MNLEELKIFENCEIGSISPFYINREKSFLGFDDSEWFNENETYYLLEIDRDGDAKVIDTSIIKERLEAKAERYNELFKKDKEFYWNTVRKIYNDWQKDIHQIYFSLKTLEDFNNAYIKFTNKHLELIDKQILPKFLEFVSLENGYFQLKIFNELSYEVKTTEKGFYDKEKTTDNSRSQN